MNDLISRQAAIDAVKEYFTFSPLEGRQCAKAIERVPSAHPEVLAHGEGELSAQPEQRWIPCSVMVPSPEDMYQVPDQRYLCQLEAYGQKKFCVCARLRGKLSPFWDWYGVPVKDSEVAAWMPLPEPYKGEES